MLAGARRKFEELDRIDGSGIAAVHVSRKWMLPLGTLLACGAVGLLIGFDALVDPERLAELDLSLPDV
jgi:hypothetical protein